MSFLNKQSLKQNTIFLFSSRLDQDMNANKQKKKNTKQAYENPSAAERLHSNVNMYSD